MSPESGFDTISVVRGTSAAARRPEVVVWIVTTQWRAQALGHAGDPNARTPALDALAADPRTLRFSQAVTPHPFGPFARAALLTGVASPENGVADYWDPLPAEARTIAHDLAEWGWATGFFGKWGVGERDRSAPLVGEAAARVLVPADRRGGFGHWVGFEGGFLINDPWLHGDGLEGFKRFSGYQPDVVCGLAADWLSGAKPRPKFALVSLETPHPPYSAPVPAGGGILRPEQVVLASNVPRGGEIEARARRELAGYYAHIAATDAAIGGLLTRLPADAVVVFTSVHGDMHGAHGLFRKGWPHEESVRVPLLVRGAPGRTGGESELPVSLLDLREMTRSWAWGEAWVRRPERALISMPCVVRLPDQCDRVWSGWRGPAGKRVFFADGTEWILNE